MQLSPVLFDNMLSLVHCLTGSAYMLQLPPGADVRNDTFVTLCKVNE